MNIRNAKSRSPLNNESLRTACPSVFAEGKHDTRSDKYSFLPTIEVVDEMRNEGWQVVDAKEQRTRDDSRRGFQKHLLRFQHIEAEGFHTVGDSRFEIVLVNSHDGSSAYQLHAGVFRLVCSNGMVVADSTLAKLSVKHIGFETSQIIEASAELVGQIPALRDSVESMQARKLSDIERFAFAKAAHVLRFEDPERAPVSPEKLLTPRRIGDGAKDAWTTLNTIQENVIRGGQRGLVKDSNGRLQRRRTRAVKGIDQDTKLNKALWTLAEALKTGDIERFIN